MLHFEGDKDFSPPPPALWLQLSDARFLGQCVPNVESVASSDARKVVCTIRPGLAFVRGTLQLTLQVIETVPDASVWLLLHTKGIGSSSDVEASLGLVPQGTGTRVHWGVDVNRLGGLLKAVPQGLLRGAAQKVIEDALAAVARKLG